MAGLHVEASKGKCADLAILRLGLVRTDECERPANSNSTRKPYPLKKREEPTNMLTRDPLVIFTSWLEGEC